MAQGLVDVTFMATAGALVQFRFESERTLQYDGVAGLKAIRYDSLIADQLANSNMLHIEDQVIFPVFRWP